MYCIADKYLICCLNIYNHIKNENANLLERNTYTFILDCKY